MLNQFNLSKIYTPKQLADIWQVNEAVVYELIDSGEINGKKIGKSYKIPGKSLKDFFDGVDADILKAEEEDQKNIELIHKELAQVRERLT